MSGTQNPALSLYPGAAYSPNKRSKFWVIEEEDENVIEENLNPTENLLDSNILNSSFNSNPSQFTHSSSPQPQPQQYQPQNGGIASILNSNNNLSGIVMSSSTNVSTTSSVNKDHQSNNYNYSTNNHKIKTDIPEDVVRGLSPLHFNQINSNANIGLASILSNGTRSLTTTPTNNKNFNNNLSSYRSFSPLRGQLNDKGGTHPNIIRNQELISAIHFSDKNNSGLLNSRSSTPINQTISENIIQSQDIFNPFIKDALTTPLANGKNKGSLHNHPKLSTSNENLKNNTTQTASQPAISENDFLNIGVFYKSSAEKVPINIKNYMLNIINNYMKGMHIDPKKNNTDINQFNNNININMKNLFQTIIDYLNDEIVNNIKNDFFFFYFFFFFFFFFIYILYIYIYIFNLFI